MDTREQNREATVITHTLKMFSMLTESDIEKMGDLKALKKFLELLEEEQPFILMTADGPLFLALSRWFGLTEPYTGREKLDKLPPELVVRTLAAWEKYKQGLLALTKGKEAMMSYGAIQ